MIGYARSWTLGGVAMAACYVGVGDARDDVGSTATITSALPTSDGPSTDPSTSDDGSIATMSTSGVDPTTDFETSSEVESSEDDDGSSTSSGDDPGPIVDVSDPQLYSFAFTAADADAEATESLGMQLAYLDTRVPLRGQLAVFLHGSGEPEVCGGGPMAEVLAGMGYHVFMPCYRSEYGVSNCDDDVAGCRLEAFEGVDHHPFLAITPPNSIERRVVRALAYLQEMHPGGDWQWFAQGEVPRWDASVISGISHGASSSGLIGQVRSVERVVMLSGPLDSGQAWLLDDGLTPTDRYFGFSHTADEQHDGHLQAFAELGLPGTPTIVGALPPPFGGSHRLVTSAATEDGHGATMAGDSSPQVDGEWLFMPVWETMYVGE